MNYLNFLNTNINKTRKKRTAAVAAANYTEIILLSYRKLKYAKD